MKYILSIFFTLFAAVGYCQGVVAPAAGSPGMTPGGSGIPGLIAGGPANNGLPPSLTTSVSTLSGFSTSAGTASASQNFTVSGSNLTANCTVTAPASYEVSLDNSTFSSSVNITATGGILASQPVTVYVRIAASASAGSPSGNVTCASTGATTQNVAVSGTVSSGATAQFNFSGGASSVSGWTNWHTANSSTSPGTTSFTDAGSGWTLQSISAGWNGFGGTYGGVNNGANTGSFPSQFPEAVIVAGNLYNYDVVFSGTYNFQFTNLPAGTYQIQCMASENTSSFTDGGTMNFHFKFGTGSDGTGTTTGGSSPFSVNNNATIYVTATGTITSGQTIQIGLFTSATGANNLGWINALIITKTA